MFVASQMKFPRSRPISQKREMGRPVDWTTADRMGRYYRRANSEAIIENEKVECSAPACDRQRSNRSHYCHKHARRLRDAGDPVCRLPKAEELRAYQKKVEQQIEGLPGNSRERFESLVEDAVRSRLRKPDGWASNYHGIHGRLPIKAKAAIVLANLGKCGIDMRTLVVRALALEAWAKDRYNGMPQNRERFIQTQIGKLAIRKARLVFTQRIRTPMDDPSVIYYTPDGPKHGKVAVEIEKKAYKNLSGTVARQIGVLVLEAIGPIRGLVAGGI